MDSSGLESVSSVGEKRVAENNGGDDLGPNKKARVDLGGDMKRVAEIVLVLSAMGMMRGSRSPSAAEKELMAEARENLAAMCEGMSPEDIFPRNAVRVVTEDLGLNRSTEQRLGFRPPKMSIAEKFQLTKRKIEESKKFTAQRFPPNQSSPTAVSLSGCEAPPPMIQVSARALTSSSSSNPLPANEVKSAMISRGSLHRPLERDSSSLALPRMEAVHFRLEGISNGSAYASQVQANSSGGHLLEKAPTCSPQLQSGTIAKVGQANKGVTQPSQDVNSVQASSFFSNHKDISKNVHMFLQPKLPEHPNWTPPSIDYMNKSLSCQICKVTINDVESLLVCDACDKGVHLKCLQSYNQKGIPKGEWHCPKCLISSNGQPLPTKFGRVTRNINVPKVSSKTGGIQASSVVENSDQKVNYQKITANGKETVGIISAPLFDTPFASSKQQFQNSESPPCDTCHNSQTPSNLLDFDKAQRPNCTEVSTNQYHEVKTSSIKETCEYKPGYDVRKDDQGVAQAVSAGISDAVNGAIERISSALDCSHGVDWVGDTLQFVDEKAFYKSCHINGIVYKLQDHALFHSNNGNLRPSKLQALWEDTKTGSKWAIVNRCYFPVDLPDLVGQPCTPENNEVYESNHGSTVRAGLIQGPCEVLPPNKFKEESERRIHLENKTNDRLQSIFLCKWFYDEPKGLFRPVTD